VRTLGVLRSVRNVRYTAAGVRERNGLLSVEWKFCDSAVFEVGSRKPWGSAKRLIKALALREALWPCDLVATVSFLV
jgi:hypothetical protein